MRCPVCQATVPGGKERCPDCGSLVAPFTDGALAPEPRPRMEPLREIPGLRKRERTWKDEVRERVRDRRSERASGEELPLFPDVDDVSLGPAEGEAPDENAGDRTPATRFDEAREHDLPLHAFEEPPLATTRSPLRAAVPAEPTDAANDGSDDWSLGPVPGASPDTPVERPARALERLGAATIDLAVLGALAFVVVYFASRVRGVPVQALVQVWPWLAGYVAFLGLAYAAYFTGATGQTIGKMAAGLRVVDAGGAPPGYLRATVRAVLGCMGIALLGGGLVPLFVDPARRAFHDRALKTRVVKG